MVLTYFDVKNLSFSKKNIMKFWKRKNSYGVTNRFTNILLITQIIYNHQNPFAKLNFFFFALLVFQKCTNN